MIKREFYMEKIRPFIGKDLIKVLTGVRRSGKSVMLELIRAELLAQGASPEQFISINFEDTDNYGLCTSEVLHQHICEKISTVDGRAYLFLDEIQEVASWEKCINSLRVKFDCDIYITGSNAKLLSGELATYLAGRYVEIVVYPFSFLEFMESYHTVFPGAATPDCFKQYIAFGGMPFLINLDFQPQPCTQYLKDVYNSVVLKDVCKRNSIRDIDLLERIVSYVMANVGQPFSATSISKYFKSEGRAVSAETVLNYIKACEEAFLFYRVRRQDLVGKKILSVSEKYYIVDHGLREAVYGKNNRDINQILENIVFMELLHRGYNITVGKVNTEEVDFVCERQGTLMYVQVSYLLASPETEKREFGSLQSIRDNYPKYVVSMDDFDMGRDGIHHLNIRDFLVSTAF